MGTLYFAGLTNGQPDWTTVETNAVPIVQDNPTNGPAWPNDSPTVGHLSVVYSTGLGLWLMTYDGGRNAPETDGIYFSSAAQPWGPWSRPQLIFNAFRDMGYGVFMFNPDQQSHRTRPDPPLIRRKTILPTPPALFTRRI